MQKFFYQAVTRRGEPQNGFIEASGEQAALISLKSFELHVTKLRPEEPRWISHLFRFVELAVWLVGFWMVAKVVASIIL